SSYARRRASGFEPVLSRTAAQPLPPAGIVAVDQGSNSGQLLVFLKALPKARNYEIKYAAAGGAAPPTTITVPGAKSAVPIEGLTPGVAYSFQCRAYGKLGF